MPQLNLFDYASKTDKKLFKVIFIQGSFKKIEYIYAVSKKEIELRYPEAYQIKIIDK